MRGILIRLLLTALATAGLSVLVHAPSYADTVCSQTDPATGECLIWIEVPGRQGHVAYPDLADNPIPRLVAILAEIDALVLDAGNAWFQPSNIEVTDLAVGNPAANVIPAVAKARLSVRFNDEQRGNALVERVAAIAARHAPAGQ